MGKKRWLQTSRSRWSFHVTRLLEETTVLTTIGWTADHAPGIDRPQLPQHSGFADRTRKAAENKAGLT